MTSRQGIVAPAPGKPVVITAAITGSVAARDDNQALPISWDEIVDSAVDCWRAGAAIIHLHARDEHGAPTQDGEIFALLVERIRAAGCDAILNLSTGAAGGNSEDFDERLAPVRLDPEMATIDCGSVNFGDRRILQGPYYFLKQTATEMRDRGVVPEIEVFDTGMIENGLRLIEEGLIDAPGVWQICLGIRGAAGGDLQQLSHMLARLPEGAFWSLLGVGRHQLAVNLVSLAYGGHVRTGMEDNVFYLPGEPATSNTQLVERIVRLAGEVGRPVATPDEARDLLGISSVPAAEPARHSR
jgi:3-keto-5-aminohexanoate cleavage enzyme